MRRVTAEAFIRIVQERMNKGQTYEQASSSLMTMEEKQRSRLEMTEAELHGTRGKSAEWNDDGEYASGDVAPVLEYVESQAHDNDLYTAIGWQSPPGNPAEVITAADQRAKLYAAMRTVLSQQDIALLLAAEVDGVPYRRLAKEFRLSKSAVARHVARAKATLKAALDTRK